jgi:hypothetical protein
LGRFYEERERLMKKINQYLPFILWSIATIILTVLAFLLLPFLIIWKKLETYFLKYPEDCRQTEELSDSASVYII